MEQKEISKLKQLIKELKEADTNEELLFGRADNYKLYKTIFEGDEIQELKVILLNTIEYYLDNRNIEKYDLEISCDDSIDVVNTEAVEEYEKLLENINNERSINKISEETSFDKINFIYFKIEKPNSDIKITIFKKFIKPQNALRKSMKVKLLGEKMKRVKEDILYLDGLVSCFEYNGKFYIFDRNHFNSLFKFREMYCRLVDDNSNEICKSEFIDDPEAFIEKCKNNRTFCKKNIQSYNGKWA